MTYRIAHFSDLHLSSAGQVYREFISRIDAAISRKVDHIAITGDIVDCGQLDVLEAVFGELKDRGWLAPKRLTVVPGNHDVFPLSRNPLDMAKKAFKRETPTKTWLAFNALAGYRGENPYPVLKKLSTDVVIAALDTTRNGRLNPAQWPRGELVPGQVNKTKRYFQRHGAARHRIVIMHNYPWEENVQDGPVPLDILEPPPSEAVQQLKDTGATAILCGHLHENIVVPLGSGLKGVLSAAPNTYSVVTLQRNGAVVRVNRYD